MLHNEYCLRPVISKAHELVLTNIIVTVACLRRKMRKYVWHLSLEAWKYINSIFIGLFYIRYIHVRHASPFKRIVQ